MAELRGEGHITTGEVVYRNGSVVIRRGQFSALPAPGAEPRTTDMGQKVVNTITIYETEPLAGSVRLYELEINGQVKWSGAGDDRADALLEAILAATGEADELPDY